MSEATETRERWMGEREGLRSELATEIERCGAAEVERERLEAALDSAMQVLMYGYV